MFVNFNILNQLGSPAINSNTFANRPAAGQTGRLFVSNDTFEIYRDNGTTWDLIGGPGSSTITGTGTATQVAYFTSSQAIGSSANLYWDNTSGFLGVGTAAPTTRIEAVKTDGIGIYANYTTNAGSGSSATAIWAKNVTNSSGYGAVIEETTPNATAGQYPLLIKHSLSSGTAGVGMGTGVHWQLPDDAGTFKTTQLTVETINAAAATYATRYRFNVQNNGSSLPVAYINSTGLGIFTATPGAALDIHSTGTIAQLNSTGTTNNGYLAFQRTGATTFSIGDTYNGGFNYFRIFGSALSADIVRIFAATGESSFTSTETYSSGNSIGVAVQHNLTIPNGVNVGLAALGGVNSNLNLSLGGSTTVANTGRQGLEGSTTINFTGAGTLTMTQGTTVRAFSALSSVYAFNGSAVGTITHLAGLRICFPDNVGSAVNITNNYALLINNQTTGTGTVTYTNRWGIYQEGASDLNYMAANLLLGSTVNTGDKLQVTGTTYLSSQLTVGNTLYVDTVFNRVGIGTLSPAYTLDVNGQARFLGNGSTNSAAIFNNPSGLTAQFYAEFNAGATVIARMLRGNGAAGLVANGLNIDNFDGFQIRVNQLGGSGGTINLMGGNVGINTNSANELLSLGFADNASNSIEFRSATYARLALITGGNNASSSNGYLAFSTRNGGSINEVMRLATNTNVGIGTITPAFKLDVNGTVSNTANRVFGSNGLAGYLLQQGDWLGTPATNLSIAAETGNGLSFFTNGSGTVRAFIPTSGNFLIGTTTDAGQKLQVNGNGYFSNDAVIVAINTTTTSGGAVVFQGSGTYDGNVYSVFSTGSGNGAGTKKFAIYDNTNNAHRLVIDNSGNTGIGLTAPTAKLEVDGAIKTSAPTGGTAAAWKLGSRVAATVVLSTTQYIEVDIGGTLYKLAIVT